MSILMISDLHLSEKSPPVFELFRYFTMNYALKTDALYILGDLFDTWIGDDENSEFSRQVIAELQFLTKQGILVYIMPGNRDFLIGETFLKQAGCHLLPDPFVLAFQGHSILLTHGDLLCTHDSEYLTYRKWIRSHWVRAFFLHVPLGIRRWIAGTLRAISQKRNQHKNQYAMDVNPETVIDYFKQYAVDTMVHGHTHKPATHLQTLPGSPSPRKRIVLGAWHDSGNWLCWDENGAKWNTFDLL